MVERKLSQLGRYRIVEELGRGTMGVVYRADDPVLKRMVAVKTMLIPGDAEARTEYEARFFQEAKAAAGLNHPNIVTVHDAGREDDIAYMAMEILDGTDLRDRLKRGRLPLGLGLDIAAQLADALAFAHQHGVIHRDIKPANIMIVRERHAKIMDFGIARIRLSDVKTATGALMGSPKYMSPEQVSGQRADHRSDIFSLGVTVYEMLTGQAPFSAEDLGQLMYQVSMVPADPPSSVDPSLPNMLDFVMAKALEKAPDARYQNAADLAADLRACAQEPQTASRPTTAAVQPGPSRDAPAAQTLKLQPTVGAVAGAAFQLSLSRRFASSAALARFDAPRGNFLLDSIARLKRLRDDPYRRKMTIVIAAAIAVALVIWLV